MTSHPASFKRATDAPSVDDVPLPSTHGCFSSSHKDPPMTSASQSPATNSARVVRRGSHPDGSSREV
jgi:hypothetical protein